MADRTIIIHVKDGVSLEKMMAAIFREYEPSIDLISMIGVDLPMDTYPQKKSKFEVPSNLTIGENTGVYKA